MKTKSLKGLFALLILCLLLTNCNKQTDLPQIAGGRVKEPRANGFPMPDHIVLVIEENHAYSQIIGSPDAPYINALYSDSSSAAFTNSYAVTHPSQPNYLALYSGSTQGVTDDNYPVNAPFTTPNLGSQLILSGKSFATFSESLPYVGYSGKAYGAYFHKHNPASNWMGVGVNQIPVVTNQPFTAFPNDYTKLPTVSIVVPDENNDMHNGTISSADSWLENHFNNYIQWAKANNSLFILTFDEDDDKNNNHIVTIFSGAMVKGGQDTTTINHYNILRTIETMYNLPYIGSAASVSTITSCWKQ